MGGAIAAMTKTADLDIFLAGPPGLEPLLREEAEEKGFAVKSTVAGGVMISGGWPDVWRANLCLRGASRVLVRIGEMRVMHLAQLDKRARRLPWSDFLRRDVPLHVEATTKRSRIYHSGAAVERVATAIQETMGAPMAADANTRIFVRIENDLCTVSVDTSGDLLHKRGFKQAVGKAPMRETLAAVFLRACGYNGTETVLDPMCGSGTFLIEAAEIASGLAPGRARRFAFEQLAGFDEKSWAAMRADVKPQDVSVRFFGRDRDAGAIDMSRTNADRAGVSALIDFQEKAISKLTPPDSPAGLIIVNPPYGDRIGDTNRLRDLYAAFGQVMREQFSGWRVGLITSDRKLATATGLAFKPPGPPVPHGPLKIRLYQTKL